MPRTCNCSGFCGPQYHTPPETSEETEAGVTRRQFITLGSIAAGGAMIAGFTPAAWARWREQQGGDDLAAWKKALHKASPPRRYRSDTHKDARMHLGGIGTGNFEIGVDGQFTTWQIFNTLRDGYVPFFFGIKAGKTAKMLQTAGGPGELPRIKSIEMTGEYPCATLRYEDAELPVHLEMTAFSPFAPLDTRLSSMPVACFLFKIQNKTKEEQSVSLAAFMQNPVGYDAMGVPISFNSVGFNSIAPQWSGKHPNFGGNINRVETDGDSTILTMSAQPAGEMALNRPVDVYTNLPAPAFNTPYEGRPSTLRIEPLSRIPAEPVPAGAATVIWLEDAATDLPIEALRAAVRAVRAGGTLVFSGKTMPLLQHYSEVTDGKTLDKNTLRPDILFEDFENGYENWMVEGDAFGTKPARGTLPSQQAVGGFLGKGLVNSFLNGDDTTGRMTSKPFQIERHYIRFLVGGGSFPTTQIRLRVGGKVVRATSGRNSERLLPASWNVREYEGQEARIEIVDEQKGGWGHINVDHIEFGDLPGSVEVLELLAEILPARFSAVKAKADAADSHRILEYQNLIYPIDSREERLPTGQSLLLRSLGAGRVALAYGPILATDQIELLGARREAYRALAGIGGAQLQGGEGAAAGAPGFGTLALGVLDKSAAYNLAFTDWQTGWKQFAEEEQNRSASANSAAPSPVGETCNGALASRITVPAGKTVEVPFFLAWRYPNKYNRDGILMGNHYATYWPDARAVATEVVQQFPTLRARTEQFRSAMYDSTLPYWMLDCLTSQISTIRHVGVVFRIANGDVYGWEGSNGCCDPTCTHVWGYMANTARLFPELERDMRRIDFKHQQTPDGGVNNRTAVPSPPHPTGERPFTDGHCSTILKAYREAVNCPDDRWLKEYWPGIKKAVEYLIARDAGTSSGQPNGMLEDDQWNTYDEALHGVTTFISVYYLAALRAGEELARRLGDQQFGDTCHSIFLTGQKNLMDRCWNGEYFQQNLPGYEKMGGEVGPGCMADQLIGQWWAHQLGLGYLLPPDKVKAALQSVFKYNWMPDLTGWKHSPRAFAGAKDKGLIICTWPKGGRPPNVMLYSDEVWTGIEYQVAAHMAYEGMLEESYAIVKGARDRYDGVPRPPIPRNPWNEIECGGHYARAGSSWTLLLALSGWLYDGMTGELEFRPRSTPERFKSLFTGPEGWGSAAQTRRRGSQRNEITVKEGRLVVSRLHLDTSRNPKKVTAKLGGKPVAAALNITNDGAHIAFPDSVTIAPEQTLSITLS